MPGVGVTSIVGNRCTMHYHNNFARQSVGCMSGAQLWPPVRQQDHRKSRRDRQQCRLQNLLEKRPVARLGLRMVLSAAVRQRSARSAARTRPPSTPASTSIARLLLPNYGCTTHQVQHLGDRSLSSSSLRFDHWPSHAAVHNSSAQSSSPGSTTGFRETLWCLDENCEQDAGWLHDYLYCCRQLQCAEQTSECLFEGSSCCRVSQKASLKCN